MGSLGKVIGLMGLPTARSSRRATRKITRSKPRRESTRRRSITASTRRTKSGYDSSDVHLLGPWKKMTSSLLMGTWVLTWVMKPQISPTMGSCDHRRHCSEFGLDVLTALSALGKHGRSMAWYDTLILIV